MTYLNTAVAVVLGVAVLSEPLTAGLVLGFPLIVAGSVFATRRSRPVSAASLTATSSPRRSWRREPRSALPR